MDGSHAGNLVGGDQRGDEKKGKHHNGFGGET
jgi:hypothetical protein